jgi:hypothetical protein
MNLKKKYRILDNKEQYKKLKQEICMVEQALEIEQAVSRA